MPPSEIKKGRIYHAPVNLFQKRNGGLEIFVSKPPFNLIYSAERIKAQPPNNGFF